MAMLTPLLILLVISSSCVTALFESEKVTTFLVRLESVLAELAEATRHNKQLRTIIENLNNTNGEWFSYCF